MAGTPGIRIKPHLHLTLDMSIVDYSEGHSLRKKRLDVGEHKKMMNCVLVMYYANEPYWKAGKIVPIDEVLCIVPKLANLHIKTEFATATRKCF